MSGTVRQLHGAIKGSIMTRPTCVDDLVLMGEIEGARKLEGESAHEECGEPIFRELDAKGRQVLAH